MELLDTVRWDSDDLGREVTLREYLKALLERLWEEGEGFSGKRPFGNSGWEYDLYKGLVSAGAVKGTLDSGYVDEVDEDAANKLVFQAIAAL
jgi:hypothetical protein